MAALLKIPLPGLRRTLHLSWARPRKGTVNTPEEWRHSLEQLDYWQQRGDRRMVLLHLIGSGVLNVNQAALDLVLAQRPPQWGLLESYKLALRVSILVPPSGLFATRAQLDGSNVVDMRAWATARGR